MTRQAPKNNRSTILGGIFALLVVVAIVVWATNAKPTRAKPEPFAGGMYYTGPMAQKGNPNMIGDDFGRVYPPPAGGTAPAKRPAVPTPGKSGLASE